MAWMRQALLNVFRVPVKWLVKTHNTPSDVENELGINKARPIIYLLPTDSITDQLVLHMSTVSLGLPSPLSQVDLANTQYPGSLFLRRTEPLFSKRSSNTEIEAVFTEMFQLHRDNQRLDVQIVPVFISWGRAPGKGKPGLADLITHSAAPNWLRKFLIVLFLGRDSFISYSPAVSSQVMAKQHGSDEKVAHKLFRVASTHFHRKRQAMTGPTLIERQELKNAILGSETVKQAIQDEAQGKSIEHAQARKIATQYLFEIAGDYREGLIRFGDRLLTRIWNKIYNGISVGHANRIRELANNGHEIIYVPCHRSHMDYLLLTYVIYHEGLVTPHIAAGINLNFWPVGGIFRRGGAFFLRRSFAGNKLYTAVFKEYLELLFNKGYAVKYYPEGGRSRTGRLIPPKTGMLAMTIQAALKGVNRPVSLVPVYIGYEHVMEVQSYLSELKGGSKKKESNWQVFSAIKKLKNYGHGYVNFGEPVQLNHFLDNTTPTWRDTPTQADDKKPSWLTPTVNALAGELMTRINSAAAINGMALVSLCLLASKTQTMTQTELEQAFEDYLKLLELAPYSADATFPKQNAQALLAETFALKRLQVTEDHYGTLVSPKPKNAVYLTYYRNNIIHLFALPGLILTTVFAHKSIEKAKVLTLMASLYPLLQRELFLHMTQDQALAYTATAIDAFKKSGMLQQRGKYLAPPASDSEHFHSSWLLSRCMQETLQRYGVVLTLLKREKIMSRGALERESKTVAERLSKLYGMHSPEFYDKNVLSSFIGALKENHWLGTSPDGGLKYSEEASALRRDILALVWPEIVQHLQQDILMADIKEQNFGETV